MKIENPSFEIWLQDSGADGIYRQIERAGRVCYKSESHANEKSARPFVEKMIKSKHTAMLEHGTVYLFFQEFDNEMPHARRSTSPKPWLRYEKNAFSRVVAKDGKYYVTTNLRVLSENDWMGDLEFLSEPQTYHERRVTVHFTTQIGTTREFNRHRANSMAEQSTRYCNYAKDKFGNEITVNIPVWIAELIKEQYLSTPNYSTEQLSSLFEKVYSGTATKLENWTFANLAAEKAYMNLTAAGCKPQEARAILPLDTNTELVHTAFVSDWKHFFELRSLGVTGVPHPDAKVLAQPLMDEFIQLGLIDDE